jgi:myxalamid-type polyketide synthase MxaB
MLKELQKSVVEEKMLCLSVESKSKGEIFQDISTFVDILNHRALQQAEQTAYIFLANGETETARLTYQQLEQKAKALAAQLQLQMSPGERALLLYPSEELKMPKPNWP